MIPPALLNKRMELRCKISLKGWMRCCTKQVSQKRNCNKIRKLFMIYKTEENELLKEINTSKQTTFFFMCCAINFNLKNVWNKRERRWLLTTFISNRVISRCVKLSLKYSCSLEKITSQTGFFFLSSRRITTP